MRGHSGYGRMRGSLMTLSSSSWTLVRHKRLGGGVRPLVDTEADQSLEKWWIQVGRSSLAWRNVSIERTLEVWQPWVW